MSNLIKKEELISYFLEIRGNEQTEKLRNCRSQCERFLSLEEDDDIRDLYNVINALMIYFEIGDKVESRKWVNDVWKKLNSKNNFSFFDIRIINHILFTEPDIDKIVKIVENVLIELEIYRFHEDYLRIKNSINLNLSNLLMDSKFFNESLKFEYEDLLLSKIDEVLMLGLDNRLHNKYYVGLASMYQGILLQDDIKIYTGLLDIQNSSPNNSYSIQQLIKIYIEKYSISKSQHTSLLIQKMNQKFNI